MKITSFNFNPMDTKFAKIKTYLTSPIASDKEVGYTAIAIALVDAMIGNDIIDDDTIPASIVMTATDAMNEIAVIDRVVFGAKLKAMLAYRMDTKFSAPKPYSLWNNFFEFIGFTAYFSPADIELINGNFQLFRESYSAAAYAFKVAFEDLED